MVSKKEDRIFGKTPKEILFQTIDGVVYPRTYGDPSKLTEEEKRELRILPHLYKEGYRGTIIREVSKDVVDKESLEVWKKYGFEPRGKFKVACEYYDPLLVINLNIPLIEVKEESSICHCIQCGTPITREEYERCDGLCESCFEVELDEIDHDAMLEETMGEEEPY